MNYPSFLMQVDQLTSTAQADQLGLFIHEIARMVPASSRQVFLEALRGYCSAPSDTLAPQDDLDAGFMAEIDSLLRALEAIQDGERELESTYNEEWDDWHSDDEAFFFTDPTSLLDDITQAVHSLQECLDREAYAAGAKLAEALSELYVHITGDCDISEMKLRKLIEYNLLDIDLRKTVREAAYLACMAAREEERGEAILDILVGFDVYTVSLEDILQTGSEEIDLDLLLPHWIEALGSFPTSSTDPLLEEALDLLQDKAVALDFASRYADSHPVLYRQLLREGMDDAAPEEMLHIGLRAMKEVPSNLSARSDIALLTAKYALAAQNAQTAESCWMEAFRTAPTVVNYLRLRLLSQDWAHHAENVRTTYTGYFASRHSWEQKPLAPLLFFDEQFEDFLSRFMQAGSGIGWSTTFMKEGLALMLLSLDSGISARPGMLAMQELAIQACSFDSDSYCQGTSLEHDLPTNALFQDCFQKWKDAVALPESLCESWLQTIGQWLELRVQAIMNANRRNYYAECAAFVAAYGEVLESRGRKGEKDRIMQQYRTKYARRSAFHEELRRFGMRK